MAGALSIGHCLMYRAPSQPHQPAIRRIRARGYGHAHQEIQPVAPPGAASGRTDAGGGRGRLQRAGRGGAGADHRRRSGGCGACPFRPLHCDARLGNGGAVGISGFPTTGRRGLPAPGRSAAGRLHPRGDRWYYAVPPTTGGFRVIKAARVVEDHLVFDSGLRLPLADDFDYGITPGLVWGQPGALFLVNGRGEVEAALQRTDQLVPPSSSP